MNVLVAGMHRSGTSAVGQVLRGAGISFGKPGQERGPAFDNPQGFTERRDITTFDDELLETLGWTWDAPPGLPPAQPPDRPAWIRKGRELVAEAFADPGPWFIKDPRISLLLPWWRKILVDRFVAVVPMRPVEEVAWSLHLRNELPLALGVALWSAYHRHLAAGLQGLPVIVVSYPALVERPTDLAPRMLEELRRLGVEATLDRDNAASAIDATLRLATQPPSVALADLMSESSVTLKSSWPSGPLTTIERFEGIQNEPASWELAMLDLQRRLRASQKFGAKMWREARLARQGAQEAKPAEASGSASK